jgi:hypothetical protein
VEKVDSRIADARKKVTSLVMVARWIWIVNSVVGLVGVAYGRYDVAALAAFTWVLSLLVAAFGHAAAEHLVKVERIIHSS